MLNVDLQKLLKHGISRYELVVATAKRARMIIDEDCTKNNRNNEKNKPYCTTDQPVSFAVDELESGLWDIHVADD